MTDRATAPAGLSGWRWKAALALLALTALFDLASSGAWSDAPLWWLFLLFFAVVATIAVRGLRAGGPQLFTAAGRAVALSLLGTAVIAPLAIGSTLVVGLGFVEGMALTLTLVACWRRAAGRRQQVITGAVALAILVMPWRLGWDLLILEVQFPAIVVVALAVAVGSVLRAADTSRDATVTAVRRAEREEVARELHDVVAHHVTGMVVLTQAARTVAGNPAGALVPAGGAAPPSGTAGLDDALAAVERAGAEALTSLRSMVTVLRSPDGEGPDGAPLERTPTIEDLGDVVRRFRESGAADRVDLSITPAAGALPPQVQAALHRVVQESLTNASRYARGAQRVVVALEVDRDHLLLTVADSGGRADQAPADGWGGGFGIVGMRERVAALGGTLTAGPTPDPAGAAAGRGWTVRAEVPS